MGVTSNTASHGSESAGTGRVLLLAGSRESLDLARQLGARADLALITLFAGRREMTAGGPAGAPGGGVVGGGVVGGTVRIGRIDSASDLAAILDREQIDMLIDATHPCLSDLPRIARQAAEAMRVPRLRMIRPMWRRHPLDRWVEVSDPLGASAVLPRIGGRVMTLLDEEDVRDLLALDPPVGVIVRLPRPPRAPLPGTRVERVMIDPGPCSTVAEGALLHQMGVSALMMRAEGGARLDPAVLAAREAGRPIVMIRRPPPDIGERAESVDNALVWIERRLTQLRRRQEIITIGAAAEDSPPA